MELTGIGVVVFLVLLFAPGLTKVLHSIAFRVRAAGKAELIRAEGELSGRQGRGRGRGKRGRRG
ncbi:hypothetical protein [Streptomyces bottropensis]|uniref:Uncharacterized protein n=1 Tax=Streptomyces bottropensis ATCC 25435 TaxID=1054862 RepID=M3E8C5_9ACTN|nr:hypothetical protein [Streptomyces bottropensis]EMF52386.1 hypothetical protein SBD_5462 [Streptomyces bottropensis ATCC 25435]MZD21504.1 hypothetical protein [Streptomyces sp. SID5476]